MRKAMKIKENIYWVGVHDFGCRDFHGALFPIQDGTSFNDYLIVDEKVTLIDTVEDVYFDVMMERIKDVIGERPIDNIIVQHGEADHSGGFLKLIELYPNITAYASKSGILSMQQQYFHNHPFIAVKTGDILSLGKKQLTFVEMPMIHWPDNMLTYCSDANVIFSNDAFGQHVCSYQMFDYQHDLSLLLDKAKDYYANIVMPYGAPVKAKLNALAAMNLNIEMIAPAHGIIWQSYIQEMLAAYHDFADMKAKDKAIIVYESIWNNTASMAFALAEGMGMNGIDVKLYQASKTSSSLIMKELMDAKAIIIGSGNYNNAMSPEIAGFVEKLTSMKPKGKKAYVFGSYGWGNVVIKAIEERLEKGKIPLFDLPSSSIQYTPNAFHLDNIYETGVKLAEAIKQM